MMVSMKNQGPFTAASAQSVLRADDAVRVLDDVAGGASSPSHGIIADMLAFTGRDTFNVPAEAPVLLASFASYKPDAPVAVALTGVVCDDGSGLFYSVRHKNGAPQLSRQVVLGTEVHRTQYHTLTIAGSHHTPVTGFTTKSNPLVADYCPEHTSIYTFASSPLRVEDQENVFSVTDTSRTRFVPWSSDTWHEYTPPGRDFLTDMDSSNQCWLVGCATIAPSPSFI